MEIFGNDWILGDFKASNFGLMLLSFNYSGESEDELGFKLSTMEEYIGNNPVPIYLGDKYEDKLRPKITLCKNMHLFPQKDLYFSEKECRWILRELTGIGGYQWTNKGFKGICHFAISNFCCCNLINTLDC